MSNVQEGYGVCRSVEDAKAIAATAVKEGLRGCYPAAAVVLADALNSKFNYVQEALVTCSDDWHGDKVNFWIFKRMLMEAIRAIENLDAIKKTLFYGRELPSHLDGCSEGDCSKMTAWFKDNLTGQHTIHGALGAVTEAGEILEALYATVIDGKEFDEVNAKEEAGDLFWYLAILANSCNFTFDEAQRTNIAKLRTRYPNKFTSFNANNRNLIVERSILEK